MAIYKDMYEKYVRLINEYDEKYYNKHETPITNEQYDKMLAEVIEYEREHNIRNIRDKVGASSKENRYCHLKRMYSIENVYSIDELKKWFRKREKPYVVERKYDGVALSVRYKNGEFVRATTRGDGNCGIKVSIDRIKGIPSIIDNEIYTELNDTVFEVRGEVVIDTNKVIVSTNYRNTVSGQLLNSNRTIDLDFVAFDIVTKYDDDIFFTTEIEKLKLLQKLGFNVAEYIYDDIEKDISKLEQFYLSESDSYETDGVVIKMNNIKKRKKYEGKSKRFRNYQIALKKPAELKITTVVDIKWDIGKTGKYTPVAVIEPINLGVTIREVTLHNANHMYRLGVGIGSQVGIIRSGNVIPKIIEVYKKVKPELLSNCLYCDSKLVMKRADIYCPNDNCKGRHLKEAVAYFKSRKIPLQIGRLKKLFDYGYTSYPEILSAPNYIFVNLFGEKIGNEIYNKINHIIGKPLSISITYIVELFLATYYQNKEVLLKFLGNSERANEELNYLFKRLNSKDEYSWYDELCDIVEDEKEYDYLKRVVNLLYNVMFNKDVMVHLFTIVRSLTILTYDDTPMTNRIINIKNGKIKYNKPEELYCFNGYLLITYAEILVYTFSIAEMITNKIKIDTGISFPEFKDKMSVIIAYLILQDFTPRSLRQVCFRNFKNVKVPKSYSYEEAFHLYTIKPNELLDNVKSYFQGMVFVNKLQLMNQLKSSVDESRDVLIELIGAINDVYDNKHIMYYITDSELNAIISQNRSLMLHKLMRVDNKYFNIDYNGNDNVSSNIDKFIMVFEEF
jgi:DNA ligase (NAD+)